MKCRVRDVDWQNFVENTTFGNIQNRKLYVENGLFSHTPLLNFIKGNGNGWCYWIIGFSVSTKMIPHGSNRTSMLSGVCVKKSCI